MKAMLSDDRLPNVTDITTARMAIYRESNRRILAGEDSEQAAIREARAILAQSEPLEFATIPKSRRNPIPASNPHLTLDQLYAVDTFPQADGGIAHIALYEALSAFISEN